MFGMGFGELTVVVVVALVIFGPKELPKVLRKLGQWAGKLRRLAADMRAQSGIDEALHAEGLAEPIRELQKLTRGELYGVVPAVRPAPPAADPPASSPAGDGEPVPIVREREYPAVGCDAYGCLPDGAMAYSELLSRSALADDELYARGAAGGVAAGGTAGAGNGTGAPTSKVA